MLYIGEKVGLAQRRERPKRPRRARRSISPSIRSRARTCAPPARRAQSPCSQRRSKGGLLHAPDLYMEKLIVAAAVPRRGRSRRARRRQPAGDRAALDRDVDDLVDHRAGSSAARRADRRHPSHRRAHPADRRRRSLRGHRRRRRRQRRARGDGHRRRAGRRAHGGGDALPERRDLRAARRANARGRGALPAMGITDLKRIYNAQRSRAGATPHLRRHRRHRRRADEGRPLLRRRHAHQLARHADVDPRQIRFIDSIHSAENDKSRSGSDGDGTADANPRSAVRTGSPQPSPRTRLAPQPRRAGRRCLHRLHRLHAS